MDNEILQAVWYASRILKIFFRAEMMNGGVHIEIHEPNIKWYGAVLINEDRLNEVRDQGLLPEFITEMVHSSVKQMRQNHTRQQGAVTREKVKVGDRVAWNDFICTVSEVMDSRAALISPNGARVLVDYSELGWKP